MPTLYNSGAVLTIRNFLKLISTLPNTLEMVNINGEITINLVMSAVCDICSGVNPGAINFVSGSEKIKISKHKNAITPAETLSIVLAMLNARGLSFK